MAHLESFFVSPEKIQGDFLTIDGDEFHHLTHVLRKRVGDVLIAVDGRGNAYEFGVIRITRDSVRGEIQKVLRRWGEPFTRVSLIQALIKNPRFDWLLEKGTELGVSSFQPVQSKYSLIEPDKKRISRWQRILIAALKQSGRSVLPEIHEPVPLESALKSVTSVPLKIVPEMAGRRSIRQTVNSYLHEVRLPPREVAVLIGPEGGLSDAEIQQAVSMGFQLVTLGARRLRAETAALTATCQVLAALDDLM